MQDFGSSDIMNESVGAHHYGEHPSSPLDTAHVGSHPSLSGLVSKRDSGMRFELVGEKSMELLPHPPPPLQNMSLREPSRSLPAPPAIVTQDNGLVQSHGHAQSSHTHGQGGHAHAQSSHGQSHVQSRGSQGGSGDGRGGIGGAKEDTPKRRRGSYKCSKCGQPKRGHVCSKPSEEEFIGAVDGGGGMADERRGGEMQQYMDYDRLCERIQNLEQQLIELGRENERLQETNQMLHQQLMRMEYVSALPPAKRKRTDGVEPHRVDPMMRFPIDDHFYADPSHGNLDMERSVLQGPGHG